MTASGADVAIVDLNSKIFSGKSKYSRSDSNYRGSGTKVSSGSCGCFQVGKSRGRRVGLINIDKPWTLLISLRIPQVTAHYADVSDPISVQDCLADILSQHGKIDNLITSAGFTENFDAIHILMTGCRSSGCQCEWNVSLCRRRCKTSHGAKVLWQPGVHREHVWSHRQHSTTTSSIQCRKGKCALKRQNQRLTNLAFILSRPKSSFQNVRR